MIKLISKHLLRVIYIGFHRCSMISGCMFGIWFILFGFLFFSFVFLFIFYPFFFLIFTYLIFFSGMLDLDVLDDGLMR